MHFCIPSPEYKAVKTAFQTEWLPREITESESSQALQQVPQGSLSLEIVENKTLSTDLSPALTLSAE